MPSPYSELICIDPLTGCRNRIGFSADYLKPSAERSAKDPYSGVLDSSNFIIHLQHSATLVVILKPKDVNFLNETKSQAHGDSAIRWMAILLQEETNQPVYRMGYLEFLVFLKMDAHQEHILFLERILERMNREAKSLGLPGAPADIVLILNDRPSPCLDSLWLQITEAYLRVIGSKSEDVRDMIFSASDLKIAEGTPLIGEITSYSNYFLTMRHSFREVILHDIAMAKSLELAQQDALTDPLSNLPNMSAAMLNIEESLQNARKNNRPFSLLMIDGDNLRNINNLYNYAAGDETIRQMSNVFKQNLRPNDFVARWRNGDEFIVTLPDTASEGAKLVSERCRMAVKTASQAWIMPVTISIGIASYPTNGEHINALIDKVEAANKRAKKQGKDQVVLAD